MDSTALEDSFYARYYAPMRYSESTLSADGWQPTATGYGTQSMVVERLAPRQPHADPFLAAWPPRPSAQQYVWPALSPREEATALSDHAAYCRKALVVIDP